MDFGNGWDLTQDQWRQLNLLEWLYDQADSQADRDVTVDRAALDRAYPGDPHPAEALGATIDSLYREHALHYVIPHTDALGEFPSTIALTSAGVHAMSDVRRRRDDPVARRPASRDALLRWLYERTAAGEPLSYLPNFRLSRYARFLSTRGDTFTPNEINDASRWLRDRNYLTGAASWGGGVRRPTITANGEHLVETGRSTRDDNPATGSTTISITDSSHIMVANHSPGTTQTSTVTISEESKRHLLIVADYLETTAGQLVTVNEDQERIPDLVTELRTVANDASANQNKLRTLLGVVRQLAIGAAIPALGHGLEALVQQALHALGL